MPVPGRFLATKQTVANRRSAHRIDGVTNLDRQRFADPLRFTEPHIMPVVSMDRCNTLDETDLDGGVLWNGCLFLNVRSCGIGGRLVSRNGRSAAGLVGLRRRCGPSWCRQVGTVLSRSVSGVRSGCRLGSGRRSRGGWLVASRCVVLHTGWGGPLRRCLVRSRPMGVIWSIGPSWRIEHRGGERNVPRR